MRFLRRYLLQGIVFVTGACVLVVEIVAVRILSPYYGNTIFTVSSVITIVLLALSCGYYAGGRLADRRPSLRLFHAVIVAGGFSVFLLQALVVFLLPIGGYAFSLVTGPLIWAGILFFAPAFLLGLLSPFAIRLQHARFPEKGVGAVSGEVFFWSTCGSIAGSLLAGFVLIPRLGVNAVLGGVGVLLLLVGFSGLLKSRADRTAVSVMVLTALLSEGAIMRQSARAASPFLHLQDGVYEQLAIYDVEWNARPARILRQDRSVSGGMYLDSDEILIEYTKYHVLAKLFRDDVRKALAIGAGAYSIPKGMLEDFPDADIDVVDIEPSLPALGRRFFKVPDNRRLRNIVGDGRRFLWDTTARYDLMFSDVYQTLFSIPPHFTTVEFFRLARSRLKPGGVLIANIIGDLSTEVPSFVLSEIKTFRSVFENSYFFAVESPQSKDVQNVVFVGVNGGERMDIGRSSTPQGGDRGIIRGLADREIDIRRFDLSVHPLLTDDFAPVEHMIARVMLRQAGGAGQAL